MKTTFPMTQHGLVGMGGLGTATFSRYSTHFLCNMEQVVENVSYDARVTIWAYRGHGAPGPLLRFVCVCRSSFVAFVRFEVPFPESAFEAADPWMPTLMFAPAS